MMPIEFPNEYGDSKFNVQAYMDKEYKNIQLWKSSCRKDFRRTRWVSNSGASSYLSTNIDKFRIAQI